MDITKKTEKDDLLVEAKEHIDRLHEILIEIARIDSSDKICGVYLIRCNNFYKIGSSTDVLSRVRALQTANPYPLELVKVVRCQPETLNNMEKEFHNRYGYRRANGEWFRLEDQEVQDFSREEFGLEINLYKKLLDLFRGFYYGELEDLETGLLDVDILSVGSKDPQEQEVIEVIHYVIQEHCGPAPADRIFGLLEGRGFSKERLEEILTKLRRNGVIFEPRSGFYLSVDDPLLGLQRIDPKSSKAQEVIEVIHYIQQEHCGSAPADRIFGLLEGRGFSKERIETIMNSLKRDGEIYEPRPGFFKVF